MNSHATKLRSRSANIFISYRREDGAGHAGRLFDHLSRHFPGRLFMDVDTLEPGVDFVDAIAAAVGSCEVLIVVIGREWLTLRDAAGHRRLDDPADFVRLEVESALARKIRVIPVVVEEARMPRFEDLPASLAALARRHAIELSDAHWSYDVDRLSQTIQEVLEDTGASGPAPAVRPPARVAPTGIVVLARTGLYRLAAVVLLSSVMLAPAGREPAHKMTPSPKVCLESTKAQPSTVPPSVNPVVSPLVPPVAPQLIRKERHKEARKPLVPVSTGDKGEVSSGDKPSEAPASEPRAIITSPRNGARVGKRISVEGTLTGLSAGQQVFLCLQQRAGDGLIQPRGEIQPSAEGLFLHQVDRDWKEKDFDLLVVVSSSPEAAAALSHQGNLASGLRGLPPEARIIGSVTGLKGLGRIPSIFAGGR